MLIINNKALKVGNKWLNPGGSPTPPGPTIDEVTIGTQTWMTKNLAIDDGQGDIVIQPNVVTNGVNLGDQYFYNLTSALRIANSISGWHLPTRAEWLTLIQTLIYFPISIPATIPQSFGRLIMGTDKGWNTNSNPSNGSGFNAVPSGYIDLNNQYVSCGTGDDYDYQGTHFLSNDPNSDAYCGCYTVDLFVQIGANAAPGVDYTVPINHTPYPSKVSVRLIKDT